MKAKPRIHAGNLSFRAWLIAACALALLVARMGTAGPGALRAEAELNFKGSSTLHDFHGHVTARPFDLLLRETDGKRTWSAEAEVAVADMDTRNKGRDENMRKMFNAKLHPRIQAVVVNAEVPPTTNPVKTTLTLRIREKEQSIPMTVTDWKEDGDGVRFRAGFEVSLKAFGLKPPSVIGLIRVADRVNVMANVTARPVAGKKTATAAPGTVGSAH